MIKKGVFILMNLFFLGCTPQTEKINGVSFVGSRDVIDSTHIQPVVAIKANWAAVMPFGFLKSGNDPQLQYNIKWQWWGEREEGVRKIIGLMHDQGIQVMVKPQIWVGHGVYTGKIAMSTENDWLTFEKNYKNFLLFYAKIAQDMSAEMLCVGTELEQFVKARPHFWKQLIIELKTIYSGKLTYAENWDAKNHVPFWQQLDYIGIDAYYPLSESKTPTIEEAQIGWQQHKTEIKNLHTKYKLPILFTEYGYRSLNFAGKSPWDAQRVEGEVNHQAQENLTQALFEEFWEEPWFAGGFHWKWFHNHQQAGGLENNQFTVQNKPAEKTLKTLYEKHK